MIETDLIFHPDHLLQAFGSGGAAKFGSRIAGLQI